MKKIISLFLVLSLFGALLLGCSNSSGDSAGGTTADAAANATADAAGSADAGDSDAQDTEKKESSTSDGEVKYTPVGEFPITEEPVEMTLFTSQASQIIDHQTNDFTLDQEKRTNVIWTFETAPADSVREKINLLFASGDLPDAFMGGDIDDTRYGASEQMLMPLEDLIEEFMPNVSSIIKEYNMQGVITGVDGHIYGIPGFNDCYHCSYSRKMWVNTYHLEEMGAEVPETIDEFYELLKQYKEYNPDGAPLIGCSDGWHGAVDSFIVNAFTFDPGMYTKTKEYLDKKENKVVSTLTNPDYKEALAFLNKLYSEGLIYEGSFTMKNDQLKAVLAEEGEPALFVPGGATINMIDNVTTPELYSHYYPISPLEGPNGVRQIPFGEFDAVAGMRFVLTKDCKYPQAALRWADWFYTQENNATSNFGPEGDGWAKPDAGALGLDGNPAKIKMLAEYSNEPQNHDWQDHPIIWAPSTDRLSLQMETDVDIFSSAGLEKLLYVASYELYEPFAPADVGVMPPVKLLVEESESIQTIKVELDKYAEESMIRFIMGDLNLDNDWDAYIDSLESIGLQTYLDVYQTAYTRQYGG